MDLVSSHYLEWRQVLCDEHGRVSCSVELGGVGSEAKIPVGVLDVKIEMVPKSRGVEVLSREMTLAQFEMEKQRSAEKERLFLVYAKQWWKEYLQIRQSHSQRLVKIFAQNESGVSRPVCAYVHPLRAGRLLDSPREAARFVSLFPFERTTAVGSGSCSEAWNSLHAMLAQRKGVRYYTRLPVTSDDYLLPLPPPPPPPPRIVKTTLCCCVACCWGSARMPMCVWALKQRGFPTPGS